MTYNVEEIRKNFPILTKEVYNKPYVYFDNAATMHRPIQVLESMGQNYRDFNGNPHRGAHYMSNQTTVAFEAVRDKVQNFLNVEDREEIIFTKGTTESINLVAYSFSEAFIFEGDEIIISEMEHHANIVPWQLVCERKKAVLKVIPIEDNGRLKVEMLESMINDRTKIVSVTMVSNVMGVVNPVKEIVEIAHNKNVPVLIDAAQAVPHIKIDLQDLNCDFLAFSGHKIYGPTGVGCLYGKRVYLEKMPPFLGGGEMIEEVSFEGTTFNTIPYKFEAGTPNYTEVIGLGAAIDFVNEIGFENIASYEHELLDYAYAQLEKIENIRFIGKTDHQSGGISFLVGNIHPYDIGMFLDKLGFAVRTGHHCAQPLMKRFEIPGTVRISFACYNTKAEIDGFIAALQRTLMMF